jgi:hypothetical protein
LYDDRLNLTGWTDLDEKEKMDEKKRPESNSNGHSTAAGRLRENSAGSRR